MTATMSTEILQRAADLAWPMVVCGGGGIQGESAWRHAVSLPGNHLSLSAQLADLEAEAARRADSAAAARERDREEREKPLTVEEQRAFLDEARDVHERYEAKRGERIEALLSRAVELLEKATAK